MSGVRGRGAAPRRSGPPRRPSRDPYGLLPARLPVAPVLAAAGLVLVAVLTLNLASGRLPFLPGGGGDGSAPPVARTPTPSDVVVIPEDPRANVPGTIVYVKEGNVWLQSGKTARQLTDGGRDSMPSFSPDGAFVYFVRTRPERGLWPAAGRDRYYDLDIPSLMRVATTGGAEPELLLDGRIRPGRDRTWAAWIRQPVVSPDGTKVAILTDLPDPTRSNVVLKLFDLATGELTALDVPETVPLGHQDPAWRPDGRMLAYVRNDRDGARGTPVITGWMTQNGRVRALTNQGYLHPSWSPDSRHIAATRTSAFGTDVVIIDSANGAEILRLTSDGTSWAPTWSPRGDAIAYLHASGQVVDLRMIELEGSAPAWTPLEPLDLTALSGLDSVSRPDWHIPASELPPTPPPATPVPASPATSPAGS